MYGYNQALNTFFFGPLEVNVDDLELRTTVNFSVPEEDKFNLNFSDEQRKQYYEEVKEDIRKNGLKNPILLGWMLNKRKIDILIIERGGNRVRALKELGIKKVLCYLKVYCYKDRGEIEDLQIKIFDRLSKIIPFFKKTMRESMEIAIPNKEWKK